MSDESEECISSHWCDIRETPDIYNQVFERGCSPELKPTDRPTDARSGGGLQLPVVVSPRTHGHTPSYVRRRKRGHPFPRRRAAYSFPLRPSLFLSPSLQPHFALFLPLSSTNHTRRKRRQAHTTKSTIALTIGTCVDR